MRQFDAVVIGSGLAGMSCALLLAKRGKKVALVEQGKLLAPLISGFNRKGTHFETGFHYSSCLGKGEVGQMFFEKLGVEVPVQPCSSDGFEEIRLLSTGRRFKMVCGRERLGENLSQDFPKERESIRRYLELMQWDAESASFSDMLKTNASYDGFFIFRHGKTLQEVLDELFVSPELKAILSTSTYLYGTPPSRASFAQHICIVGAMYDSMWEIVGGAKTLVTAYRQALERAGVEILLSHRATRIELSGGKKHIHFADEATPLECDFCIGSIHPREFVEIAPPNLYRSGHIERIKQMPETNGFFSMYAVNHGIQTKSPNHVFLLPELDYDKMSPGGEISPYYINFSHGTPQSACVIVVLPHTHPLMERNRTDYPKLKADMASSLQAKLRQLAPDMMEGLEFVDSSSPATQKRYVGYSGGYGIMHDVNHASVLPVTKIPGIYLAGQSVVAPGLIGTIVSAFLLNKIWDEQRI